jgi:hypothetical protein
MLVVLGQWMEFMMWSGDASAPSMFTSVRDTVSPAFMMMVGPADREHKATGAVA